MIIYLTHVLNKSMLQIELPTNIRLFTGECIMYALEPNKRIK